DAHDYRYFPEPDLPPLRITAEAINQYQAAMPELPEARRRRFVETIGLSFDDAAQLVDSRAMADYYEAVAHHSGNPKAAANWILNELARELKSSATEITASPVSADNLAALIKLVDAGTISGKMAKDALIEMYRSS